MTDAITKPLDIELPERVWFCDDGNGSTIIIGKSELDRRPQNVSPVTSPAASTLQQALDAVVAHENTLARFWLQYVRRAYEAPETSIRIDGHHYLAGPERAQAVGRGHAGRRFVIRFEDGRELVSTNLWHQGVIPAVFRDILSDNAVFVREA